MGTKTAWTYHWADLPWLAGIAACCAVLTKIALTFYSANGLVTIFWPASGLGLAVMLLGGRRFTVALYLGAVAGQLWVGKSGGDAALIALGSTLEPVLGAWLLSRKSDFDVSLRSTRDFLRLIFLAAALSPAICTLIGVSTLRLSGRIAAEAYWPAFAHWWMGDTLGIVLIAPLILIWRRLPRETPWNALEAAALLGLSFLIGQIVFLGWFHETLGSISRGYWIFLVVFWAAVRLGRHAVLIVLLLATVQALLGAALGVGYFGNDLATTQLTNFWAYTMILATLGMSLAILLSERKKITAELSSSEDRLRLAKNAAALGVYDYDLASGQAKWDERMRELFGLAPDAPVSLATFMAGVHSDDRAATQAAVKRAFDPAGTGDFNAEYRVVSRADGCVRYVAGSGRVFFEDGRAERSAGVMRDITTQKRLEQEIQERRIEMEALTRQQIAAQTASALAHELNQPLIAVSAYSEAALRMLQEGITSPDKLVRALQGSVEQTQRAGRTLHELLDVLHKGDVVAEPVDINVAVQEAIEIAVESGYGGFHPVIDLEPDLPQALVNRLHLEKVLVNLLRNSTQAMHEAGVINGTITIMARTQAESRMVQFTLKDSGPGLDPETAQHVFQPFFTTKPNGIGLGLAISGALIKTHGGHLWVDTATSPGATFHFTLPIAP
jgi:PAS domain S-box-containing protein